MRDPIKFRIWKLSVFARIFIKYLKWLTTVVIFLNLPFRPDTYNFLSGNWDLGWNQAAVFIILCRTSLLRNLHTHWNWNCLAVLVGLLVAWWNIDPFTVLVWNGLALFAIIVAWLALFCVLGGAVLLLLRVALLLVDCRALVLVFRLAMLLVHGLAHWKLAYLACRLQLLLMFLNIFQNVLYWK